VTARSAPRDDAGEHEHRAVTRTSDIAGLRLPGWRDIQEREYEPWPGDRMVIDTARHGVAECVAELRALLPTG
jgi:hypothetical protein